MLDLNLYRSACDSLVAMGSRTRGGRPIFAKNSDRPAAECQPLIQCAAADYAPGARLACQYLEIEQVVHTHAFVGARPHWLWGCEHGLNEHGVAIGNHTIFTKDPVAATGLCGMDLVRLGLERGGSAAEALAVIVALIERHGQGGSGFEDTDWPYHNSFLIADATEAWLLEASASHWVARRAEHGLSASNHTTIAADWDLSGHDVVEHARAQGWWDQPDGVKLDFAAAYRDAATIPPVISSGRHKTTCGAIAPGDQQLDVAAVMRVMRDHYESGDVFTPGLMPDDERYFSVCEHADPVGTTTASMVAELHGPERPQLLYAALASPCIGAYLPLFPDAPLPAALLAGGRESDADSAWWTMKALLSSVEVDFVTRGPRVRDVWRPLEAQLSAEAEVLVAEGVGRRRDPVWIEKASAMMQRHWERVQEQARALTMEFAG